jgi:hypothetical protein
MARTRNLPSALSVSTACTNLAVLTEAQQLNETSMLRSLHLLVDLQKEMIKESDLNEPALSHRKNFRDYKVKVERCEELLSAEDEIQVDDRIEAVQLSLGMQVSGMKMLHGLIQPPSPVLSSSMNEMVEGTGIRVLDGTDWERLKVESRMPAMSVLVEGREWRLIDDLNVLDPDSEREHSFEIGEAIDWWRSQVKLKYPDGAIVGDEGIGHKGGFAQWEVHNVVPGQPLVVIRRMDYARGDYWCRVWVNDVDAGEVPCNGDDVRYRWRNWPFYIHPHFVRHRVIRIKQGVETANRDVNFFRLWFYQPV